MVSLFQVQIQLNSDLPAAAGANAFLATPFVSTALILAVLFFVFLAIVLILRNFLSKSSNVPSALKMKVLLIAVPKVVFHKPEQADKPQDIQEQIGVAENIFAVLGGLRAQRGPLRWLFGRTDHFAAEIVSQKGKINFYLAIPDYLKDTLEQQIHSAYPYCQIEELEDYNIFSPQGEVVGAYLKFGRDFIFPIKTYRKSTSDPLNSLTNALAKVGAEAGAAIQFVARSSHKRWHRAGVVVSREMQRGKPLNVALGRAGLGNLFDKIIGVITGAFSFFKSAKEAQKEMNRTSMMQQRLSPMETELVKAIEEKTSKAGLDVNIRIVAAGPDRQTAGAHLQNIINAFAQYNVYSYGNGFKKAKFVKVSRLLSDFIHRSYLDRFRVILNAEEMCSLWHLPLPSAETPNINWLEARKAPPPLNLPQAGLLLGESLYRGAATPIRIKEDDRLRHMYVIGKSGTGKSVFLSNMIIQDIKEGRGVCVIDPHGDLVDSVMEHIPADRAEDAILFDPSDTARPIALNMLEFNTPEQKTFVINEMINIFDKLYDLKATGGPMFEQYMRNAMLLMMEDSASGSTLLEVPKVLADANFRKYKLSKCSNPVVRDFWEKEASKAGGEASLANMVPYITSKLTPFVSSDLLRPIIAQQASSFNFRKVMDEQKILLIKLSKGIIGDLSANLLGMVVVGKILMSALSRVELPEEERKNYFLYIDEFQNFITESISIILSEARKYRLSLTVAHQYINQLVKGPDASIKDAVFGNVGTMAAFRIGPEDAELVAKQFAPVFNEYDLINIPKYNAYLKILIDNQNPPAFNLKTYPPARGDKAMASRVKEFSRLKYGRDSQTVEREITERIKLIQT